MNSQPTIRLTLAWWEALLILIAYAVPAALHAEGVALLTAIAASIAFAVWRLVRILGQLLDLRQAEFFTEDNE